MAYLTLNRDKLRENYQRLAALFEGENCQWGVVTKLLCGNALYLDEVLALGARQLLDARIHNLEAIKQRFAQAETVYIRPASLEAVADIVTWADVSLQSSVFTCAALSREAGAQNKIHKVVLMVEMGDLREGVVSDELEEVFAKVARLPHLEVVGLGTNLNCFNGTLPSRQVLKELVSLRDDLEKETGTTIPWISAGTTVTLPILINGDLPEQINHFRIGEALFFGKDIPGQSTLEGFHDDVFTLHAQVVEAAHKPSQPSGELGESPLGQSASGVTASQDQNPEEEIHRALLDVGYLDSAPQFLSTIDPTLSISRASSDLLGVDAEQGRTPLKVGDWIELRPQYMGVLHLMSSDYIAKRVISNDGEILGESHAGVIVEQDLAHQWNSTPQSSQST